MDKFNQSEDIMMPETFSEPSGTDNKPDETKSPTSQKKVISLSKKTILRVQKRLLTKFSKLKKIIIMPLLGSVIQSEN